MKRRRYERRAPATIAAAPTSTLPTPIPIHIMFVWNERNEEDDGGTIVVVDKPSAVRRDDLRKIDPLRLLRRSRSADKCYSVVDDDRPRDDLAFLPASDSSHRRHSPRTGVDGR